MVLTLTSSGGLLPRLLFVLPQFDSPAFGCLDAEWVGVTCRVEMSIRQKAKPSPTWQALPDFIHEGATVQVPFSGFSSVSA